MWKRHPVRRDRIICGRKYLVESSPNGPLISLHMKRDPESYLRNPHMEGAIDSLLTALMPEWLISTQYVIPQIVLLSIDLHSAAAFTMQFLVVGFTDTSPKCCLCRSGDHKLFDMTNYCPLPTRVSMSIRVVLYVSVSLNG
jgi:hypothetical protein